MQRLRERLASGAYPARNPTQNIAAIRKGRLVLKGGALYYPDEIHEALGITGDLHFSFSGNVLDVNAPSDFYFEGNAADPAIIQHSIARGGTLRIVEETAPATYQLVAEYTDFTFEIPYPFVTQGAVPVHVYSGVTIDQDTGQICLTPGTEVAGPYEAKMESEGFEGCA